MKIQWLLLAVLAIGIVACAQEPVTTPDQPDQNTAGDATAIENTFDDVFAEEESSSELDDLNSLEQDLVIQ